MPQQKRGHICTYSQCIAQRHGNVALPSLVADAAYWAALGALQKFGLGPIKQFFQLLAAQAIARVKVL